MPKRVPEEAKRVPLNCLVLPATLEYLRAADGSQGYAVDRAVAALRMQEAQRGVMVDLTEASATFTAEWGPASPENTITALNLRDSLPRAKAGTKRGPRPKGDKNR